MNVETAGDVGSGDAAAENTTAEDGDGARANVGC